jgi:hypothetical protein
MSISTPERLAPAGTDAMNPMSRTSADDRSERRAFRGWPWVAVGVSFPVASFLGWTVGGRVDAVYAALVGGALTGAGIGAVQWWAAKGRAAASVGRVSSATPPGWRPGPRLSATTPASALSR